MRANIKCTVSYTPHVCALPLQVYDFVRELQSIDVLLFNFIAALDKQLGLKNLSSDRCGYVSLDGSADSKAK